MLSRRRHHSARGQLTLAALVLVVMFGLLSVSVLAFINQAAIQHRHTESTASSNTLAEGAAAYAVSSVYNGASATACSGPSPGRASYSPTAGITDTMSYTIVSCIPNYSLSAPGQACALCVLSTAPGALTLNNHAKMAVNGEIDVNGGISLTGGNYQKSGGAYSWTGGTICSFSGTGLSCGSGTPDFIGVGGTATNWPPPGTCSPCPYSPGPQAIDVFDDPLRTLPTPALGNAAPVVTSGTISPGIYQGINVSGGTVVLTAGTYIFTGLVTVSGGGKLCSATDATCKTPAGVTLYFACGTTTARACNAGEAGGAISVSGNGFYSLTASTGGTYKNVLLFYDRSNTASIGLVGGGNGSVISGTAYGRSAAVSFQGNGSGLFSTSSGQVVAATVNVNVAVSSPTLALKGGGLASPACDLYNATVSGSETTGSGTTTRTGQVLFTSSNCSGGARIISFVYTP